MVKKTKHIRQGRLSEGADIPKLEEATPWVENGSCPVPMVLCCKKGIAVGAADAVKMFCSSKDCTINNVLHKECFEELEIGLIKILQNKGSARRWTEDQRMSNLWTKKGMNILARFLRCKCSKGILDKREDFRMPEKPTVIEVFPKTDHVQHVPKAKKRELPSLNTGPRSSVTARNSVISKKLNRFHPHFMDDHSDDDMPIIPKSSVPPSPSSIPKPKPVLSPIPKEKTKLTYLSKKQETASTISAPSADWPALDLGDDQSKPLPVLSQPKQDKVSLKPRKTFSEVTQQCKPKVIKKPPEDNVYKVLSRKDLEVRRLPGFRKPSEPRPSESERSITSRRSSECDVGKSKGGWKDVGKKEKRSKPTVDNVEDKTTPLQIHTEFYQTGPIPGLAHELMSASPVDVCHSTPSTIFPSSHTPSSPSYSERSNATFESDENIKPPPISITEALNSIRLRSALTSQFLDLDKYDFGPKYKTNEVFIQSLIRDATDFFHPPPFLDELGFNPSLWTPI